MCAAFLYTAVCTLLVYTAGVYNVLYVHCCLCTLVCVYNTVCVHCSEYKVLGQCVVCSPLGVYTAVCTHCMYIATFVHCWYVHCWCMHCCMYTLYVHCRVYTLLVHTLLVCTLLCVHCCVYNVLAVPCCLLVQFVWFVISSMFCSSLPVTSSSLCLPFQSSTYPPYSSTRLPIFLPPLSVSVRPVFCHRAILQSFIIISVLASGVVYLLKTSFYRSSPRFLPRCLSFTFLISPHIHFPKHLVSESARLFSSTMK